MLSVRFHYKTYYYDLSVPFQPHTISLMTEQIRALQLLTQTPCAHTGFLIKGLEISHTLM